MKKYILIFLTLTIAFMINAQQNEFFIKLSQKELATFNDGITLMRLLYNERDDESTFIENILWAAEKKLFQVTIPIKSDEINPILTRREFAYWICRIYNNKNGLVNTKNLMRFSAFNTCVKLNILSKGRGGYDSFTGSELLDTFSYLDYHIRYYNIKPNEGILNKYDTEEELEYEELPEWREQLYRELDEQRAQEKAERDAKKQKRKEKNTTEIKKVNKKDKPTEVIIE